MFQDSRPRPAAGFDITCSLFHSSSCKCLKYPNAHSFQTRYPTFKYFQQGESSLSKMQDHSDRLPPPYTDDIIKAVQKNPDYGYGGRIHSIRHKEYGYLGGMAFRFHLTLRNDIYGSCWSHSVSSVNSPRSLRGFNLPSPIEPTLSIPFFHCHRNAHYYHPPTCPGSI